MRIGGLASGIDTESIIKDLMNAERLPLNKMEQDRTILGWQRDKFREINTLRLELDHLVTDMQLSKTYKAKTASSTMEGAVTATATSSALEGTYNIAVSQLASTAINVSTGEVSQEIPAEFVGNEYEYYTYDENGNQLTHKISIAEGDTVNDVLKQITDTDNNMRAFFDSNTNKVVFETTRTGNFNTDETRFSGNEIGFNNAFFTDVLKMSEAGEQGGTNAKFTYNDAYEVETTENKYTLNGVTFEFKNTTPQNADGTYQNATITVKNDTDATVEKITTFVEKYNELIDMLNGTQREEKYRDYPPLTEEQKKEMDEKEIELWDEKAKSGILRGDTIISSAMFDLRQDWYKSVNTGGEYDLITDIGISTTKEYLDGGKLEIDEDKLREALTKDPDSVYKLFAGSDGNQGITDHLDTSLEKMKDQINERAGRSTDTLTNYTLGKRIKDIDDRMSAFQDRLQQTEDRYWRQFSAMEEAISMMNQQSAMLMSNFGGGM
nr:flagellar hook-associated protein 2 [Oceanobacillus salinisoli]